MSIKYSLIPNHLTDDPEDYMAIVEGQVTRDMDAIIDEMVDMGSTVTKADILSVMDDLKGAVENILGRGENISTSLFQTGASISGVFSQFEDFDRSEHYVRINTNPGELLNRVAETMTVERIARDVVRPVVVYFKDFGSGTTNETLTSGGGGEIRGSHLKIDESDADQGIYFIASDGTETKVPTIMRNMPSNLIFLIPEGLLSGEYKVEVRTKPRDGDELRSGSLGTTLIIP